MTVRKKPVFTIHIAPNFFGDMWTAWVLACVSILFAELIHPFVLWALPPPVFKLTIFAGFSATFTVFSEGIRLVCGWGLNRDDRA